jgi:hypothetical protein
MFLITIFLWIILNWVIRNLDFEKNKIWLTKFSKILKEQKKNVWGKSKQASYLKLKLIKKIYGVYHYI